MNEIEVHKSRFIDFLEPIITLFIWRRDQLANEDWLKFVEQTRTSIIQNPEQYLGRDLPKQEVIEAVINSIFDDFMKSPKVAGVLQTTT